ncbi:hemoglobin/transferrin/lactoferrin receptor protein [Sphingopyxis sp. YR583]|uniref:TonB-dependent receptor domain-containing protein n=1 Tax=Sphingopyxis sp. YR583 TaxID=1881047 RepID=UPI0008A7B3BD|nr:TonB-dependent receptor [Sphingopyxis sp. YR583]SEH17801.1 hemoglobin/transferrin/lactoferrin receptor protein [Sphingopyxis sp. YR583]
MTIRTTILTSTAAMLSLASHAAYAQEGEGEFVGDIVVVGALTDVEIDRKEIEVTQANDLVDLFRNVPSVSVGGGVGLAQKIYVRGLEDSLLNVTIDGAPQRGTLFHHIGRVTIEPEILETVDVQAGPGEATAGFGAVGGAIRFRTRNAVDMLQDGRNIGGIAKAGWFSNDGYKLSGTVYGRIAGDIGILASYVHVNRDPYKDGDGVRQLATGAEQNLGFVKVGGELGGGHRITASYEQRRERGSFGQRPNWPVLAGDRLFDAKGKRQTAILNYGFQGDSGVGVEATGYWTRTNFSQDRFDRWGLYGAEIETYGFDVRAKLAIANHDITVGAEHRRDAVTSEYLGAPAMWQPWAWDPNIGSFTEKGSLMGVYVQDHWRLADPLLISFGARYDAYDLDQKTYRTGTKSDGLSFNIGAEFEIVPGLSLNAGFAEAFRGEEIGDAFTLEKRPGRLSLSPTLRPERVDNLEGGVKYDLGGFTASAVYYEMTIKNVILDQLGRDASQPAQDAVYYENVGKFKSKGVELRAGYRTGPFSIDAYYNHYDSRLNGNRIEGYEHIALGNSMGDNWAVTAGFQPSDYFNFRAGLTRYEDLNNIEVLFREVQLYPADISETQFIDKPGYTTVDLFGSWRPFGTDRLELQAAVYNLFDKRYIAHASVADYGQLGLPDYAIVSGLPEPGRNVRLTASIRF